MYIIQGQEKKGRGATNHDLERSMRSSRRCERNEAIHHATRRKNGLLRFARNDGIGLRRHDTQQQAGSPTMSGCRASATAGETQITSACAPKIAAARYRQASAL